MSANKTASSQGTPKSEMRLMTSDSHHMNVPSPRSNPATAPETKQMAVSHCFEMAFNSSMPSINMLLPRDTIMASSPQPMAAANDSPTSTRQATLPNGRMAVQNQE